jgi:hypothetical protein
LPQPLSAATYEFLDDVSSIVVPLVAPHTPMAPPSPASLPVHRTRSTSDIHVPPREWLNLHASINMYSSVPSSTRAALKDPN